MRSLKIVTFGGGGGQSQILTGLRDLKNLEINSICTSVDSGGSTGILRKEFEKYNVRGYIGDVSKCMWALSKKTAFNNDLMFRYPEGSLKNHSLKNLIYSALIINHGQEEARLKMQKVFGLEENHNVFPVSMSDSTLKVKLASGQVISGETYIDNISRNSLWEPDRNKIIDVWLNPDIKMDSRLEKIIVEADFIIICPGDLFTSIIPSLLPKGVSNSIVKSKAKLIFITNIMTKLGETDNYGVLEFVSQIERYLKRSPDYVLCNNGKIPNNIIKKYKLREHKVSAVIPDKQLENLSGKKLISSDLIQIDKLGRIRHDCQKIRKILENIFSEYS